MQQHDSDDAQSDLRSQDLCLQDLRLQDLRLHLGHCGAILLQRRLFIIGRRRAGADTRRDEISLAELELKVLRFEEQYRICLEREARHGGAARRGRSTSGLRAEWPERSGEQRFFDKSEGKVPAAISPALSGRTLSGI
jgi:hypothetical protein